MEARRARGRWAASEELWQSAGAVMLPHGHAANAISSAGQYKPYWAGALSIAHCSGLPLYDLHL